MGTCVGEVPKLIYLSGRGFQEAAVCLLLMVFVFQALLAQIPFECLEKTNEALTLKERLKHPSI